MKTSPKTINLHQGHEGHIEVPENTLKKTLKEIGTISQEEIEIEEVTPIKINLPIMSIGTIIIKGRNNKII